MHYIIIRSTATTTVKITICWNAHDVTKNQIMHTFRRRRPTLFQSLQRGQAPSHLRRAFSQPLLPVMVGMILNKQINVLEMP